MTDAEILAEFEARAPWFGKDPIRTREAVELGKYLPPAKFDSTAAYVDAVLASVQKLEDVREKILNG